MAEEEKIEDNSIEEEKVDEEPESEPPAIEEEEEVHLLNTLKNWVLKTMRKKKKKVHSINSSSILLNTLDGRSRKVVLWTLGIFLLSTFNFIAWNFCRK